jgi:hypothetical protein
MYQMPRSYTFYDYSVTKSTLQIAEVRLKLKVAGGAALGIRPPHVI